MAAAWQRQQAHLLPHQQRHLSRAHVATTVSQDKHVSTIASSSATCTQCRLIQSVFYCTTCLSERIILQHADRRRLGEARQRGRDRVDILLGVKEAPAKSSNIVETQLPNPFIESLRKGGQQRRGPKAVVSITGPHHGASIPDRIARATLYKLEVELEESTKSISALRERIRSSERCVIERRHHLDRRKRHLDLVRSSEKQGGLSHSYVDAIRSKVEELRADCKEVAEQTRKRRARLASIAFDIFDVQAPPTSTAIANRAKDAKSLANVNSRSQRSRERYSGGAFALDFSNAFDLGKTFREAKTKDESNKVNDWTILGSALPTPNDIYRIDRAEINGALHHTVQLLQLVTAYLDITLPFVFSVQGSSLHIRANPLWGAGSRETLHLSEATYNYFTQSSRNAISATVGSMGASMMSTLGASTLSTLESFVQLPSAKHLPWSKGETANATLQKGNDQSSTQESQDTHHSNNDPSTVNARRFCTALTMLSFNVAYLVHVQGIQIDLIMASGNALRLISRAIHSPDLGKFSHSAFIKASNLSTLQIHAVDFAQLSQIHEPFSLNSKNKVAIVEKKPLSATTIMEESYVDAKKAAESILHLDQKKKARVGTVQQPGLPGNTVSHIPSVRSQPAKMSSLAAKRVHGSATPIQRAEGKDGVMRLHKERQLGKGGPPPAGNTLDFLRARGQRDVRTSTDSSPKITEKDEKVKASEPSRASNLPTSSITRGTVTFNGKEVRGKAKATHNKNGSQRMEEDGWHVL